VKKRKENMRVKYRRYQHLEKKSYGELMSIIKRYSHFTPRELVVARLCSEFRDPMGRVEMTWIGDNFDELVPFAISPVSRQNISTTYASFKKKLVKSGVTFFFSLYSGLITSEEMLTILEEVVEGVKTLIEIEAGRSIEGVEEEVMKKAVEAFRIMNERIAGV
jgi:hypothetical protein